MTKSKTRRAKAEDQQRIQIAIAIERDLKELSGGLRLRCKKVPSKSVHWIRYGIRALYRFYLEPEGSWSVESGARSVAVTAPVLPNYSHASQTVASPFDATLKPRDDDRLFALQQRKLARNRNDTARLAIYFVVELVSKLTSAPNAELVTSSDGHKRVISLDELFEDCELDAERVLALGVSPPDEIDLSDAASAQLQPGSEEPEPLDVLDSQGAADEPLDRDLLYAILLCVTASNRFLALKAAEIGYRAQQQEEPVSDERAKALETEYDLLELLKGFSDKVLAQSSDLDYLALEIKQQSVLPTTWLDEALTTHGEVVKRGMQALIDYVTNRMRNAAPWSDGPPASKSDVDPTTRWRSWTRSRASVVMENGAEVTYRELFTPIEWTAVLHHWLARHRRTNMTAHDLQSWLSRVFPLRYSKHFDALVATCGHFNQAFYGRAAVTQADMMSGATLRASQRHLSLDELLETLSNSNLSTEENESWTRFVYLWLNLMRVVRPVYRWKRGSEHLEFTDVQLRFRSLAAADATELRARVFGAQSSINGLHWILRGGIVPRREGGRVWLIYGEPGSGKSTFALQLAADMARRGRVAIVVCAEERAAAVRERLVLFGQLDPRRYDVVDRSRFDAILANPAENELVDGTYARGLLVIYTSRRTDRSGVRDRATAETIDLEREIERIARAARLRAQVVKAEDKVSRWKWLSLVVDSIDALEVVQHSRLATPVDSTAERKALNALVSSVQKNRLWGIVVCGAHNPQRVPLSYLSDTVIELGTDAVGMQRGLQIRKCRTQPCDPGVHTHELLEGIGSVVYPNLASVQRWLHRRSRRGLDRDNLVRVPGWIHWPGGKPRNEAVGDVLDDSWTIQRGASVLLYGGPQSGKSPFLLNLIAQRMSLRNRRQWRLGANGGVHIISFRGGEQEFLRPLSDSKDLVRAWIDNIADVQQRWYAADEARQASHITYDLMRTIQRSRRDSMPLDWIVFTGIEAVKTNFLALNAEKSFWPTVLAIAASEQISTAFIVSDTTGTGPFVSEHRQDMDYVFRFERERHQRKVHIERSVEAPSQNGYSVLSFEPTAGEVTVEYEVDETQARISGTFPAGLKDRDPPRRSAISAIRRPTRWPKRRRLAR